MAVDVLAIDEGVFRERETSCEQRAEAGGKGRIA